MKEFFFQLWIKIWSSQFGVVLTFLAGAFIVFVLFAMGSEWVVLKLIKGTQEQAENVSGYAGSFGMLAWFGFLLTQFIKRRKKG